MGLTIHYQLHADTTTDPLSVVRMVRQARGFALDLPFAKVGRVVDLRGEQCQFERRREELQKSKPDLFWLLIQATSPSVKCPWNKRISRSIAPERIVAFTVDVGDGCENMNVGLCTYPEQIEWGYRVEDDQRFESTSKERELRWTFDYDRFNRYRRRVPGAVMRELRTVPTGLAGWNWHSFCKTEYANNAECGGTKNFLRCHIAVVTLLERIATVPGLKVRIEDEGHYGPGTYADDWAEATAAGRKPRYRRHKGKYSPAELAREIGESNERLAAIFGVLKDKLGPTVEGPIQQFQNFEQLEFRGRQQQPLRSFLAALGE